LEFLTLTPPLACRQCLPSHSSVRYARRIEPLDKLSEAFEERLWPQVLPIDRTREDAETINVTPSEYTKLPSPPPSVIPGSVSSEEKRKSSRWPIFKSKPPKPPQVLQPPKIPPESHCFSSDGKRLILWSRNGNFIYVSTIPENALTGEELKWNWITYGFSGVQLAAGGKDYLAMVSRVFLALELYFGLSADLAQTKMKVFSIGVDAHISATLDKSISASTVRSLVVSRDGKYLAVGLDRKVFLYDLLNVERQMEPLSLSTELPQSIESQRLNFSLDGSKIVLATRYGSGSIEVRVYAHETKAGWSQCTKAMSTTRRVSTLHSDLTLPRVG
jgi:WD40 repeat protein